MALNSIDKNGHTKNRGKEFDTSKSTKISNSAKEIKCEIENKQKRNYK